jgi:hypothetical protein
MAAPDLCVTVSTDSLGHWHSLVERDGRSAEGSGDQAKDATESACMKLKAMKPVEAARLETKLMRWCHALGRTS